VSEEDGSIPLCPAALRSLYNSLKLPDPNPSSLLSRMFRPLLKPARASALVARKEEYRILTSFFETTTTARQQQPGKGQTTKEEEDPEDIMPAVKPLYLPSLMTGRAADTTSIT
jgi:hypothetical protein